MQVQLHKASSCWCFMKYYMLLDLVPVTLICKYNQWLDFLLPGDGPGVDECQSSHPPW